MLRIASFYLLAWTGSLIFASASWAQSVVIDPYGVRVVQTPSPYWGYSANPYSNIVHGVADIGRAQADIIRAQGEFLINKERAALEREKVRVSKLETRKKELEHWQWERDFMVLAAEREQQRKEYVAIKKSESPPLTEILSGKALTFLATKLPYETANAANSVKLDPEWLKHVHFACDAGGNLGLLKSDKLPWPLMLRDSSFEADRAEVERLFEVAKVAANNQGVSADTILALRKLVDSMQSKADSRIAAWSFGDSIRANRFLREIHENIKLLENPDTAFYLTPLQGETVAELMQYMKRRGVRTFGPATEGSERHYIAFHRALVEEMKRLRNSSSSESSKPQ